MVLARNFLLELEGGGGGLWRKPVREEERKALVKKR